MGALLFHLIGHSIKLAKLVFIVMFIVPLFNALNAEHICNKSIVPRSVFVKFNSLGKQKETS